MMGMARVEQYEKDDDEEGAARRMKGRRRCQRKFRSLFYGVN